MMKHLAHKWKHDLGAFAAAVWTHNQFAAWRFCAPCGQVTPWRANAWMGETACLRCDANTLETEAEAPRQEHR